MKGTTLPKIDPRCEAKAHKSRWTLSWLAGRSVLPQLGVGNNKPSIFIIIVFLFRGARNKRRLTGEEPEIYQRAKKRRLEGGKTHSSGIRQKKGGWRRARPLLSDKLFPAAVLSLGVMHDPFPNDSGAQWWSKIPSFSSSSSSYPLPPLTPRSTPLIPRREVRQGVRPKERGGKMVN